jgi:carbon storage regulator
MLVLRRKVGESIVLAGVINISVLAVEGERVKIGISAPPDVTIVREELLRAAGTKQVPDQNQQNTPAQPH